MTGIPSTPATSSRIGLIVPSSNTTMETEIPQMLQRRGARNYETFTFHSSRARLHTVTTEELAKMVDDGERCAVEVSDADVDVIAYACLVAVMAQGPGAHRESEKVIAEAAAANGHPAAVVSSAGALVRSLAALGAQRVAIVTPYVPALTRLVTDTYTNSRMSSARASTRPCRACHCTSGSLSSRSGTSASTHR